MASISVLSKYFRVLPDISLTEFPIQNFVESNFFYKADC